MVQPQVERDHTEPVYNLDSPETVWEDLLLNLW